MISLCKIEGCGKPSRVSGWCSSHYGRWWRNGDPLGVRTPNGEPDRYFREVVLLCDSKECLIWPYSRDGNGYGQMRIDDAKKRSVHRLACEAVHGLPPTPEHEAAHSCGRGNDGCVNPGHLSWKTHIENEADKLAHGTQARGARNGYAKLTEPEAREILALKGQISQDLIAAKFGVGRGTVGHIHQRRTWGWL